MAPQHSSGPLNIEDHERLLPYLIRKGVLTDPEATRCQNLKGGVSNRTVLVMRATGTNLVVKQALRKLRVQADWFSAPERIHREYLALGVYRRLLPGQAPRPVFQDLKRHVIGMEEVPSPHENWKERMLAGKADAGMWSRFGNMLAQVHTTTNRSLAELPEALRDRSFFETLRLEPYYLYTGTQLPAAESFLTDLAEETRAQAAALVHGDYSPKNVLLQGPTMHLLDYEVCHVGDPAFDVGFALAHALSKAHKLAGQRLAYLDAASKFWSSYESDVRSALADDSLSERASRHLLACLLARAVGRSPLEYLSGGERKRQVQACLPLLRLKFRNPVDAGNAFAGSLV